MTTQLLPLETLSLTKPEGREKVFGDVNLIGHVFSYLLSRDASTDTTFLTPTRPLASLENVRSLGAKLSQVCRSWRRICSQHMATIVGSDLGITRFVLHDRELFLWCLNYDGNPLRPTTIQLKFLYALNLLELLKKWDLSYLMQLDIVLPSTPYYQSILPTILSRCNGLMELAVFIALPNRDEESRQEQYDQVIGQQLFFLPTIQRLHLSIRTAQPLLSPPLSLNLNPNNILLSNLFNLPHLVYLKLSGNDHYSSPLPIASKTLQVLDVANLRRVIVPCNCPQLQDYRCDILKFSGTLPHVTQEREYRRLMRDYVTPPGKFGHLIVTADQVSFPGLAVPNTCRVTVLKLDTGKIFEWFPIENDSRKYYKR